MRNFKTKAYQTLFPPKGQVQLHEMWLGNIPSKLSNVMSIKRKNIHCRLLFKLWRRQYFPTWLLQTNVFKDHLCGVSYLGLWRPRVLKERYNQGPSKMIAILTEIKFSVCRHLYGTSLNLRGSCIFLFWIHPIIQINPRWIYCNVICDLFQTDHG